jgi:hypothetical protein
MREETIRNVKDATTEYMIHEYKMQLGICYQKGGRHHFCALILAAAIDTLLHVLTDSSHN